AAKERFRLHFAANPPLFRVLVADPIPRARPLAAYALSFLTYSTFLARPSLWLEDLYVRPQFRKRGIATRMLAHLAATAVEQGCGRFEWSVLDWNTDAQRFYQGLGALVMPDWRICRLTGAALTHLARSSAKRAK